MNGEVQVLQGVEAEARFDPDNCGFISARTQEYSESNACLSRETWHITSPSLEISPISRNVLQDDPSVHPYSYSR